MLADFEFSGGSVTGRDHRLGVPKNRQDDFVIVHGPNVMVAVIADGCSSGGQASLADRSVTCLGSSEVGASLAVRLLSELLVRLLSQGHEVDSAFLKRAQNDLIAQLHVLANAMGGSLSEVVDRYFLFTLIGVIMTEQTTTFFALGDGVIVVNDDMTVLEAGADNQPIYLGYSLSGSSLTDGQPELLDLGIVQELPTDELDHFLIGSDGVNDWMAHSERTFPGLGDSLGDISQFWTNPLYFKNRKAIERKLNLAARDWSRTTPSGGHSLEGGLLADDTTLVVGRRLDRNEG